MDIEPNNTDQNGEENKTLDTSENENKTKDSESDSPLPDTDFEVIQMQKSGSLRIPKSIREEIADQPSFACWKEDNRIIYQMLSENQLTEFAKKKKSKPKSSSARKTTTDGEKTSKPKKKKKTKMEPELTRYFPFQFDNQQHITEILESTFYILFENPPQIEEAIERLKYGIIKYCTGSKTNDARLKHSYILFISDVLTRNPDESLEALLDFSYMKLLPNMESRFLVEQARIEMFILTIRRKNVELGKQILTEILDGISLYKENYAIMQGFKNLIKPIQLDQFYIDPELKYLIYKKIKDFIEGFEVFEGDNEKPVIIHSKLATDKALELIELLVDLQLIEEAFTSTQELLDRLPPEDVYIEQVRAMLSELKKMEL